jgi:hypothetical protein
MGLNFSYVELWLASAIRRKRFKLFYHYNYIKEKRIKIHSMNPPDIFKLCF